MKIQFPVKASLHDSTYRRVYFRIPKAAWIAYKLEKILGKLMSVSVWDPERKEIVMSFFDRLKRYRDTGRFVTGMWHDLDPTYYIMTIEEPEE